MDKWKIAYHEAAHAAAAIDRYLPIDYATILPSQEHGEGHVSFPQFSGDSDSQTVMHDRTIVSLAGGIAVNIIGGDGTYTEEQEDGSFAVRGHDTCRVDHEQAMDTMLKLYQLQHPGQEPTTKEMWRLTMYFLKQAKEVVFKRWDAVDEIAAALLERGTLSGDELLTIYKHAVYGDS